MKNKNILWLILMIILYIIVMFVTNYILKISPLLLSIFSLIIISIISLYLYKKKSKDKTIKSKLFFSIPSLICCIVIVILLFSGSSQLNYVEEQVYDRITSMVNEDGFFNPKEARLLDAVVKYEYSDSERKYIDTIDTYYIKVIGTNKVGGTINECYRIYYSDYKNAWDNWSEDCESIYKSGMGYEQLSSNSIKNINKALQKYWNNLGL